MPALSLAVSGKDWSYQPPTHAPTHPTVTAAMVFVDSTSRKCVSVCLYNGLLALERQNNQANFKETFHKTDVPLNN